MMGKNGDKAKPAKEGGWIKEGAEDAAGQVAKLIADGVDPDAIKIGGEKALSMAAMSGHLKMARMLLAAGADPDARSGAWTIMGSAIDNGASLAMVRALLDAGADPNKVDGIGMAPIHRAASKGRPELVQELIRRGADGAMRSVAASQDQSEWEPLRYAMTGSHFNGGSTPGVSSRFARCVDLLAKPAVAASRDAGRELLGCALLFDDEVVAAALLDAGADLHRREEGPRGRAPLEAAAQAGSRKCVELLLARGARPVEPRGRICRAARLAAAAGKSEIAQLVDSHAQAIILGRAAKGKGGAPKANCRL